MYACSDVGDEIASVIRSVYLDSVFIQSLTKNPACVVFGRPMQCRRHEGLFTMRPSGARLFTSGHVVESVVMGEVLCELVGLVNRRLETAFDTVYVEYFPNGMSYLGRRRMQRWPHAMLGSGGRQLRVREVGGSKRRRGDIPIGLATMMYVKDDCSKQYTIELPILEAWEHGHLLLTIYKATG